MAGDNNPAQRAEAQSGHRRVAFYGRCGSMWGAPLSLLRQIHAVETTLSESIPIRACFAEIGVWDRRRHATPRVLSLAGHRAHGGLVELVQHAHECHCGFDVVVCADEFRLPRRVSEHQAVLLELIECGAPIITLFAAIPPDFPGSGAPPPQTWSSGLSGWATQARHAMCHLTDGPIVVGRVEVR